MQRERIEAWTVEQAADVLSATSISAATPALKSPVNDAQPRGTTVALAIPLDEQPAAPSTPPQQRTIITPRRATVDPAAASTTPPRDTPVHTVHKRRTPIRRDSLARREALLKGKEGSRQRRRWENDRLLNNPYAEPPLPSDWEAKPTYPVRQVPYFLAPLWDAEFARVSAERERRGKLAKRKGGADGEAEEAASRVASELRSKMKKARGARGLLQDLEEAVREFVEEWEGRERELEKDGLVEAGESSDDDEIVFVGRGGVTLDERRKRAGLEKDKLVFQSAVEDQGAAFGRYLVHSIAEYYGLRTWSKTTGDPARREAYVGLKTDPKTRRPSLTHSHLPRPLWTVV